MRNRVIKAEFWADEKTGSCSCVAQLLFIGSWNFADDSGVCRANSVYLRNNIFPYSSLTIKQIEEALIQLKDKGIIALGEFKGEKYLYIKNFLEHQKIDRPSKFRYINADYNEVFHLFNNTRRGFNEGSTLKGKVNEKGKGKEDEEQPQQGVSTIEEHSFYGEYCNVGLTDSQHGKLLSMIMNQKALDDLIEVFGKKIEIGKEDKFTYELPNLHFERLLAYWKFRRMNPQKFKNESAEADVPANGEVWSLKEM